MSRFHFLQLQEFGSLMATVLSTLFSCLMVHSYQYHFLANVSKNRRRNVRGEME